jgi:hypothetical protein
MMAQALAKQEFSVFFDAISVDLPKTLKKSVDIDFYSMLSFLSIAVK